MAKLLIFDAFTLLIREKNVANYALLRWKTFSLKVWLCKIFDKYHVCFKHSTVFIIVRFMMGVVKRNVLKEVPVM